MSYMSIYILFSIFATFILKYFQGEMFASISVILVQLIVFYFMKLKYDRLNTSDNYFVLEPLEKEVRIDESDLNIKSKNYLFLFIVYLLGSSYTALLLDIPFYISNILNFVLMFYIIKPIIIESYYGFKQKTFWERFVIIISSIFLMYSISILYNLLLEYLGFETMKPENQILVEQMVLENPLRMFFSITIVAAITEELIFRGIGFRSLVNKNRLLAYVITFFAFGFPHILLGFISGNGLSELIHLPTYGFMGVIFARAYEKSGSIFLAMGAHFVNNLIGFIAIMYSI